MVWREARRRGLGALALVGAVGVVVGVVGWGGFNTVMEATNQTSFCISCHEMRSTVYEEYKTSVHFRNASGVRAECADCHVPRDWTHKVIRKVAATRELYHWAVGTIDTPEKFEDRRYRLARNEWDRMRASDSRECRNCHSFEAMDFHKQTAKAATAMESAMKAGKTCIDCHKGVAHTLPDITAGHRRSFAALAGAAAALEPRPGTTLYALSGMPLHLERPTADAAGDGTLAPSTAVTVAAVEDGFLRGEITGWYRGTSHRTLFALQGKRIPLATLSDAAAARLEPLGEVEDADTGQTWTRVRLPVWTRADGYVPALATLWGYAAEIYDANCTFCHAPYAPDAYAANTWIGNLNAMKRMTPINGDEAAVLQAWLQLNARDTAPAP
ncbi:NapC/NirT family cytochrome c [Azospirillum halopraeferens]|uniref:NapC/NirT family cytochrome c n=1 Tax=Azospirillum halopraeferens TaxID=34010 RepID=UPI000423A5A1|nr:NapC/NirT family cytochrome c [Azospirillum halopraeferens]